MVGLLQLVLDCDLDVPTHLPGENVEREPSYRRLLLEHLEVHSQRFAQDMQATGEPWGEGVRFMLPDGPHVHSFDSPQS